MLWLNSTSQLPQFTTSTANVLKKNAVLLFQTGSMHCHVRSAIVDADWIIACLFYVLRDQDITRLSSQTTVPFRLMNDF
ncbi:hypothetical protein WICPIJ_009735 [Wickerhamomyces pijperi]|uniref:Uncharacterized protein n=1 Tax=Wickerhamomyces pijperi TaxID=599730 RepID=A0A9P8PKM0_WICPI|nr:hypothetical protein WICPIJ_009735 [Wickerhamomyces pijperi]